MGALRFGARVGLLVLGVGACHAGLRGAGGGPGAPAPAAAAPAAAGRFSVVERAETGPITALAFHPPYLFAASARGLRRWDVTTEEMDWIGPESGLLGHRVSALSTDGQGRAWVATESGIGRLVPAGDDLRYEPKGGLARVTALLAGRAGDDAWAAAPEGLFHLGAHGWSPVDGLHEAPVSSLDLDPDGRAVWVETHGRGLFQADERGARLVVRADAPIDLDVVLGTAVTAAGIRVVAGRSGPTGAARLLLLSGDGDEAFHAQPDARIVRVVAANGDAVLLAGPPGAERAFTLRPLDKGETPAPGSLRFVPVRRPTGGRWQAVPLDLALPPRVTVAAAGGGALYLGSERMGAARAEPARPHLLAGSELVGDAERIYVACAAPRRCLVVTDGPRAWLTDGDAYAETRVGEAAAARVVAVAGDAAGALYAISTEPRLSGLVITRALPADGDLAWQPFLRVPLALPVAAPPAVSLAAVSPEGTLWIGVRAGGGGGRDDSVGFGAVEVDLGTRRAIQHRPVAAGEARSPDTLPLPPGLTGVLFDRPALWFSSMSGVSRCEQGQLRSWGENEGMPSELAHGVAKGPDGKIWAATSEGLARFDGRQWRGDGSAPPVAARALVRDASDHMWVATAKGLRVIAPADASSLRVTTTPVDGDIRDVVLDRFGRVWALSAASIAFLDGAR